MKETKYAGTQTEKNLMTAFAGESEARNKYTYFASKAKKEGYEQIAALFLKTAENEKEHAKLWFKALNGIGSTAENLAAAAAGEKSLSMLPTKELEGLTGYVRGGCSPVGMKKRFPTLIDETAQLFDIIGISGGRRGLSLRLSPDDLASFTGALFVDICREETR